MRKSTSGLAIEILSKGGEKFEDHILALPMHYIPRHHARLGINSDSIIVSSLDFQDFYDLLSVLLDHDFFYLDSKDRSVQLGAFICIPLSVGDELDQLAWVPNRKLFDDGWCCAQGRGIPMQNGWTRFESSEISDLSVSRCLRLAGGFSEYRVMLSQANHILSRLQITDDYEKYGLVNGIDFTLHFPPYLPNGYLFLCPLENFQTPEGLFQHADAHAYWSLDPSGTPRLSLAESIKCGFPAPQLKLRVSVCSWKWYPSYALRQFHLAKGFDPDSQDVAIHLGYPLYQTRCPQLEPLFTHVEDHSSADNESPDSDDGHLQLVEDDSQRPNTTAAETHPTLPRFSNSIIFTILGIIGVFVLCRSRLRA
ncbi:hypothetical protein K438DRAFT_524909 [Mycena galopus ATCC 62051]|nr:hypothetical protein K438DRAFT_524909 [Mycena galopus ATCC 62051]